MRLCLALTALLLLASCVPLQNVGRDIIGDLTGDRATLNYCLGESSAPCFGAYGFAFDPSDDVALAVILDVLGDDLATSDARCEVVTAGLQCQLGNLAAPSVISLSGGDVTATATYRRPASPRIYQALAR